MRSEACRSGSRSKTATGCLDELLDGERLRKLLSGTASKVICVDAADSTSDLAFELAGRTALPVLVCCERQERGRGRHGRKWAGAPRVSLMFTILFSWEQLPVDGLSLAAGLGVWQAMRVHGASVMLKWPNDLVAQDGGKIAGLLVEIRGRPKHAAIGVGINLRRDAAVVSASGGAAAFLEDTADCGNRNSLLADATRLIAARVANFASAGFAPLRGAWLSASAHSPGDRMKISVPSGARVAGEFSGITESGSLVALVGGVSRQFSSAEICAP